MDGTPHGGLADDAPTAPQPPLTPEVVAAMSAAASPHPHERTAHAHEAPGGVAPHEAPHHAAPEPAAPVAGRRRALLAVGAAVVALAVAGGAMAFAAGRTEPQAAGIVAGSTTTAAGGFAAPPAAEAAPGVTATAPMLPAGQDTLVLGDSLGLTVYPWLADLVPDRYVSYEAEVGRGTPATYDALRALPTVPPVVLVSLGTNDFSATDFERAATRVLDELGPDRCVVWTDIVRPDRDWSSAADMNAALDRAVAGRPNVSVLRWTQLVEDNPEWMGGDGIHPNREGAEGRARAFAAASLACSPLDPDAPRARKQYVDPTVFMGPIAGADGTGAPAPPTSRTATVSVTPAPSRSPSASASASSSPSDVTTTSQAPSTSAPPETTSAPPPTSSPPADTASASSGG